MKHIAIAILTVVAAVMTGCRSYRACTSTEIVDTSSQFTTENISDSIRSAEAAIEVADKTEFEQHADSAVLTIERDSVGLPVRLIFQSSGFSKVSGRSSVAGASTSETTLTRIDRKEESSKGYSMVDNKNTTQKEPKSLLWNVLGVMFIY